MLIVVGTNHKCSPIEVRERLSIPKGRLRAALAELADKEGIRGAVILSTCNRVEVYADAEDANEGVVVGARFIAPVADGFDKSNPYLYTYKGREAISHLFEVACGLDSQIIGERQILEQVELAWNEAKKIETTNNYIDFIFDKAIKTGYRARRETEISSGDISIASILLELIKTRFIDIRDKKILIIGVGKVSELVVQRLKDEKVKTVFIANKTYEKARQLAGIINAEVVRFDQLRERLKEADVVITATASPHPILRREDIAAVIARLLIIDLAVPRNVEQEIKKIEGVELFDLDDLGFIIEKKSEEREQAIPKVLEIINEEISALCLNDHSRLEPEPALLP